MHAFSFRLFLEGRVLSSFMYGVNKHLQLQDISGYCKWLMITWNQFYMYAGFDTKSNFFDYFRTEWMKPIKARTFWDNIGSLLGDPHFHTYMSFDGELTTPSLRHRFSEMSVRPTLAISGTITTNSTEFSTKFAVIYKIICQAKIKNIVHELH